MIQSEVINKLAMELCLANGDFDHFKNNQIYIQMALSIGIDHYAKNSEEITALNCKGELIGNFKDVTEASDKLGITRQNIQAVLRGRCHTAGGCMFYKVKDVELIKRIA